MPVMFNTILIQEGEMVRLRNTSPFYLTEGIDFGDYDHRIRIARAARRIAQRSIGVEAVRSFTRRRCQDRLTEGRRSHPTLHLRQCAIAL
jgi:hypothetical protein